MAKAGLSSLRFLKMLKKRSPDDVEFFTSSQVPKGKCYVFTNAKDSEGMKVVLKKDGGDYEGYLVAVTLWLACIGGVTLVNYTCKGIQWIINDYTTKDDH